LYIVQTSVRRTVCTVYRTASRDGGSHVTQMPNRRRPGPKGTLSDQTILDAAQNLLSSGGAGAVTVRGIAAQVGVAPNAVYTYFPGKAAVLRALVERLLSEVDPDGLTGPNRPWRQRLRSWAAELS